MEDYSTIRRSELLILCTNMDESQKHDAERMKPETKEHMLSDSISTKHKKNQTESLVTES